MSLIPEPMVMASTSATIVSSPSIERTHSGSDFFHNLFHGIQISSETTCGITLGRNRSNAGFAGRHSRDPSSLLNMRSPMLSGELTDSMSNLF